MQAKPALSAGGWRPLHTIAAIPIQTPVGPLVGAAILPSDRDPGAALFQLNQ
jgi:hypothetical protein